MTLWGEVGPSPWMSGDEGKYSLLTKTVSPFMPTNPTPTPRRHVSALCTPPVHLTIVPLLSYRFSSHPTPRSEKGYKAKAEVPNVAVSRPQDPPGGQGSAFQISKIYHMYSDNFKFIR
eukprot:766514-Hanusia_phi.AAC.7